MAKKSDAEKWNDFITENTPNAFFSLYSLFEWRNVLVDAYGYKPYYIVAERDEKFVGSFPLMYVRGVLFKDRLISLPFIDHGCGPCVEDHDTEVLSYLIDKAREIAHKLNADSIMVCSPESWVRDVLFRFGFEKVYDYCTVILDLGKSKNDIWAGFEKRIRNAIRKAEKSGIQVSMEKSRANLKSIYEMHVDNMMKLGTPPHSKLFFEMMLSKLAPSRLIEFLVAEYRNRKIAAIIILPHRDSVRWGVGVQLTKYRSLNPMNLLLWEAIKWANENDYKSFDFGGTRPNTGNFLFKRGWINKNSLNGRIVDLKHLHFFLKGSRSVVDVRESKYEGLSSLWRSFMPKPLAKQIGPWIRKQIAM